MLRTTNADWSCVFFLLLIGPGGTDQRQTPAGETVTLSVNLTDTMADVAFLLRRKKGIYLNQQRLFFGDKRLSTTHAMCELWSYNIQGGSTLHLAHPRHHGPFMFHVKCLTGKTIYFDVCSSDTVHGVMEMLQDREGIPPEQQRFIFAGRQLEKRFTLLDYNVEEGSTAHLIIGSRSNRLLRVSLMKMCATSIPRRWRGSFRKRRSGGLPHPGSA